MGRLLFPIVLVAVLTAVDAQAQSEQRPADTVNLSGPRVGVTFLSNGVRRKLNDEFATEVGSIISQFGWQKEKRFLSSPSGVTGVTEFVLLVGGMEQGVFLPSLNWLVGMRSAKGIEFAVGPNVTAAGLAMAAAAGVTFQAGNLNVPVNIAVVPSKSGMRVSLLAGFNTRRR